MAKFNNTKTTLQFDDKICSFLDFFGYKYISKLSFTKSYYIFQKIDIAFAFQILKFYMIFICIYIKRFCFLFSHLLNFLPHSHKMMYTGNHESPPWIFVLSTSILTQEFGAFSISINFSYKNFTLRLMPVFFSLFSGKSTGNLSFS